ncbi:MAG: hypothetical protein AAB967_03100 [Patescibacteria group bacterium]
MKLTSNALLIALVLCLGLGVALAITTDTEKSAEEADACNPDPEAVICINPRHPMHYPRIHAPDNLDLMAATIYAGYVQKFPELNQKKAIMLVAYVDARRMLEIRSEK